MAESATKHYPGCGTYHSAMTGTDERGPLWGIEWDFLAVDATGSVALLSSAGYGPIPARVLALSGRSSSALSREGPRCPSRRRSRGRSEGPEQPFGRLLRLVHDERARTLRRTTWRVHHGPYRLVSAPTVALEVSALGRTIREAANLVALPLRFAAASELRLE